MRGNVISHRRAVSTSGAACGITTGVLYGTHVRLAFGCSLRRSPDLIHINTPNAMCAYSRDACPSQSSRVVLIYFIPEKHARPITPHRHYREGRVQVEGTSPSLCVVSPVLQPVCSHKDKVPSVVLYFFETYGFSVLRGAVFVREGEEGGIGDWTVMPLVIFTHRGFDETILRNTQRADETCTHPCKRCREWCA